MKQGKVYLVGAGPGDPGLITVKGLDCLRRADVIVYDRLVDETVLSEADTKTEKIYVGKASSHHTLEQDAINQLLIEKAKEGKTVVRLKGGDPFVLGRGGKKLRRWLRAGFPLRSFPGFHPLSPCLLMPGSRLPSGGLPLPLQWSPDTRPRTRENLRLPGTNWLQFRIPWSS